VRRAIVLGVAVLAGLSAVAAAAAPPRHTARPKCPPANEGLVAGDAQALLYTAATRVYESEAHKFVEGREGVFGCAYGAKRAYYLGLAPYGGPSGSGGVGPSALAGAVVAYEVGEDEPLRPPHGHSSHEIWVRNLRTGQLLHRMPDGSPAEPGDVGLGDATAIVVKSDGSVAWIVGAPEALGGAQLRSVDKTGSHLLAASPEIAPASLALAGSTLYWTQGGRPMSAALQ
jgi:hypothetical protein